MKAMQSNIEYQKTNSDIFKFYVFPIAICGP